MNSHKQVPVWSALFVPPAESVEQLVHDHTLGLTPLTYGDVLFPTSTTNVRETSGEGRGGEGREGEDVKGGKGRGGEGRGGCEYTTGGCTKAWSVAHPSPE